LLFNLEQRKHLIKRADYFMGITTRSRVMGQPVGIVYLMVITRPLKQ
jgi:hypothetical protein